MKSLVVYYSLDGNTRFIANVIADEIKADVLELTPKKDIPKKGFMKFLVGGKQVFLRKSPELINFDKDPNDYTHIFIGTPVWGFRHAPALETFFTKVDLEGKGIALFCCHGGGKGKTLDQMRDILKGNDIIGQIDFKEPLRQDKEDNEIRARSWSKEIIREEKIKQNGQAG